MPPVCVQDFEKEVDALKASYQANPPKPEPLPPVNKNEKKGLFGVKNAHGDLIQLCDMIYEEGFKYADGTVAIPFGILFQVYSVINNRVVGILSKARKHGLLYFEGEMLYQVKDDNKAIMLLKPIEELRKMLTGIN